MPIPKPRKNEKKSKYISRFMSNEEMIEEFSDVKQRLAVAHQQWRNKYKTNESSTQEGTFVELSSKISPLVRFDELEGKRHLVAPAVLIREGVHNGSGGPKFYPGEEIDMSAKAWNHKPVVVYHPELNGTPVEACSREVINKQKVGILMATDGAEGKLKSELWLDVEKTRKVDKRVIEGLQEGKMIEVSTGLFTYDVPVRGTWNDEEYDGVATCFAPDHLALLPDRIGACSIEDGAGFPRNNEDHSRKNGKTTKGEEYESVTINGLSHQEIREKLEDALKDAFGETDGHIWVVDIYEDHAIYEKTDAKGVDEYYDIGYMMNDSEVALSSTPPIKVEKVVQYIPVNNNEGGSDMNREQKINELISNDRYKWVEKDKKTLEAMEDETLDKLFINDAENGENNDSESNSNGDQNEPPKNENQDDESNENEPPENNQQGPQTPQTLEQFIGSCPDDEMKHLLVYSVNSLKKQKAELIKEITKSDRNGFTQQQLEQKDIEELEVIKKMAKPPVDFSANASTPPNTSNLTTGPLPDPYAKNDG